MYYIGIDLGGTNIAAGLVNENGEIICKKSTPTLSSRTPEEIVKDMAQISLDVAKDAGVSLDDVASVGIACPGFIEKKLGILITGANLPFSDYELRKEMNKYIDKPIYVISNPSINGCGPRFLAINLCFVIFGTKIRN